MIVSRTALKEIRSKQLIVQKRRTQKNQSGRKKTIKDEGFIKKVKGNQKKESADFLNELTIKQNLQSMVDSCSEEKPFRLFLEDESSQENQRDTTCNKEQESQQRIFTLGDVEDQGEEVGDRIADTTGRILLPIRQQKPSSLQYQINSQIRTLLKMLHQMSFIPPCPIKYSSRTLLVSKRLNEDEDQYFMFSKLFQRQNGILYLKKIFLLQESDLLFMNQENNEMKRDYAFGFFNGESLGQFYKKMMKNQCLLSELIDDKMKSNLANYLSPVPGVFGCNHIAVRYLNKKTSAFDSRNLTPACYLIESKQL